MVHRLDPQMTVHFGCIAQKFVLWIFLKKLSLGIKVLSFASGVISDLPPGVSSSCLLELFLTNIPSESPPSLEALLHMGASVAQQHPHQCFGNADSHEPSSRLAE